MASKIRIGFIGSGAVNFGGAEGPWDHASRLEKMDDVTFVGIADPVVEKARNVLEARKNGDHGSMYSECTVYDNYKTMLAEAKPKAVFIGIPPSKHGSCDDEKAVELFCVRAGVHCFIEKPLSVSPPQDVEKYGRELAAAQMDTGAIVSVGYMFRYHGAVRRMREVLDTHKRETGSGLMYLQLVYNCAYSQLDHPFWWRKEQSGGPIVEQATHFCDLARFLGGEVQVESLRADALKADDPSGLGRLSHVPAVVNEDEIPEKERIPRVTHAQWRFASGALGVLTHGLTLHHKRYESSLEAWADGLRIRLEEPYWPECCLRIRRGDTDKEMVEDFGKEDPYMNEDVVFMDAVRTGMYHLLNAIYVSW